jgi:cytidylate kinase
VIRDLAEKESSVIIGRCAGYILREQKNCVRVFVHAPIDYRINLVKEHYHENAENMKDYILKLDKSRANYHHFFTQEHWGRAQNYHICLDSSIGIPSTVRLLRKLIEELGALAMEKTA